MSQADINQVAMSSLSLASDQTQPPQASTEPGTKETSIVPISEIAEQDSSSGDAPESSEESSEEDNTTGDSRQDSHAEEDGEAEEDASEEEDADDTGENEDTSNDGEHEAGEDPHDGSDEESTGDEESDHQNDSDDEENQDDDASEDNDIPPPPTPHPAETPIANGTCPLVDTCPVEVRIIIFELLLKSPDLARIYCINDNEVDNRGCVHKYDLHPRILETCRKLMLEGYDMLYKCNTFFAVAVETSGGSQALPRSPITRYRDIWDPDHVDSDLHVGRTLFLMDHWKVLISNFDINEYVSSGDDKTPDVDTSLNVFCKALRSNPPKSMEVLVILKGVKGALDSVDYFPLETATKSVKMLRGVGKFILKDAELWDVPDTVKQRDDDGTEFDFQVIYNPGLADELKAVVQGSGAVEYSFDMLPLLINYARAFERVICFKNHMGTGFAQIEFDEEAGPKPLQDFQQHFRNPFLASHFSSGRDHPVEAALDAAVDLENEADTAIFKTQRAIAVEYLERQYQTLLNAHNDTRAFITEYSQDNHFLSGQGRGNNYSPLQDCDDDEGLEALVSLQRYARAFDREHTFDSELAMVKQKIKWTRFYDSLPREMAMAKLAWCVEHDDFVGFVEKFKIANDDMDRQFLEIQKARTLLYYADAFDVQCKVSKEDCQEMLAEMVVWPGTEVNVEAVEDDDNT